MKNYNYYDAYHRRRRMPGVFLLQILRGKKGVFLLSFFIALLFGKLFLWKDICQFQDWNITCIGKLDAKTIDQRGLLIYLLVHRGELVMFLLLSGITKLRKILYYLCSGAAGGVVALILLSFIHSFGIKGAILLLVSLTPHWIIYGILFVYLYWIFVEQTDKKTLTPTGIVIYALGTVLLFGVGIYLECFVNPLLLQWTKAILKV